MRKRDADLGTLWEGVCVYYEERGLPLPWYWRTFHRAQQVIMGWRQP